MCQHRITGTGAILALAEIGQSDGRGRQAGTGDDHAVSKNFQHDFSPAVLVLAVGDGVDQSFPQRLDGIFIQPETIEANDAHRMAGVSGQCRRQWRGQPLLRHRPAECLLHRSWGLPSGSAPRSLRIGCTLRCTAEKPPKGLSPAAGYCGGGGVIVPRLAGHARSSRAPMRPRASRLAEIFPASRPSAGKAINWRDHLVVRVQTNVISSAAATQIRM